MGTHPEKGLSSMKLTSILVGYDGSEHSNRALERASAYARAFDAQLIVVTAEMPVVAPSPPGLIAPVGHENVAMVNADAMAADVAAQAKALAADAEVVIEIGNASDVIVQLAEERDVDLIVVGTSEPGFLERLLIGSTSQDVVRKADRDVLVVH